MKSKEFRIGNAVFDKFGEIAIIDTIGFNSVRLSTNKYKAENQYYDEIKPIPLTEEILLKCGFKKHKLAGYEVHFVYNHSKLHSGITAIYNADF